MSGLLFCRECSEGKHGNCDGTAWSNELDAPAPCTCPDPTHMSGRAVESDAPAIERIDRYSITVNGHRITANEAQEGALRSMGADAVERFLVAMGRVTPPAEHKLEGAACSCGEWEAKLGELIHRGFDRHLLDVTPPGADS